MKIFTNKEIDEKIIKMLKNFNFSLDKNTDISPEIIETVKNYLSFTDSTQNKIIIAHIFIYNYALWLLIYENEEEKIPKIFSELSLEDIIKLLIEKPVFYNWIIKNYLEILSNPELTDYIFSSIPHLQTKTRVLETNSIFSIMQMYLEEIYTIYSNYCNNEIEQIILAIIKHDQDPFDTYLKYFPDKEIYLKYKIFLVQILYIDAYLYLLQQREEGYVSEDTEKMLTKIKEKITTNDTWTLPDDDTSILMLISFYYFNTNRSKLIKQYPKSLKEMQEYSKKRIHPIILSNYFN